MLELRPGICAAALCGSNTASEDRKVSRKCKNTSSSGSTITGVTHLVGGHAGGRDKLSHKHLLLSSEVTKHALWYCSGVAYEHLWLQKTRHHLQLRILQAWFPPSPSTHVACQQGAGREREDCRRSWVHKDGSYGRRALLPYFKARAGKERTLIIRIEVVGRRFQLKEWAPSRRCQTRWSSRAPCQSVLAPARFTSLVDLRRQGWVAVRRGWLQCARL